MTNLHRSLVAGLLALSFGALPAKAQQTPVVASAVASEPGKVAVAEATRVSAVVTALDQATRRITLKGPKALVLEVVASDEVRNFDQIKVGDELVVKFIQAVSLELKKGSGIREHSEISETARAKPGEKPAGAVANQVTIVADVIDVNPKKKTITLKGPKGNTVELNVKNPDHFKVVKKGDQVEAVYIEALAVAVEPAPKKGAKQ